ncbi:hypothetical protein ACFFX1_19915 [Dactylosporangium sucinum]|uniref:Uncharacterized protein n=1 Tax=Dactylosporangium sucinum TaxID=1424081 RepID=A0A917X7X7_9ACTN|nr:hypothetical protein GCM10007977_108050 [Dactylosporangium sucinum]
MTALTRVRDSGATCSRVTDRFARTGASDREELARFGYEPSFERRTSRFASFAVAFAFVSIATGSWPR